MNQPTPSSPRRLVREGIGIVRLRDDGAHEGTYRIDGSWVTLTGRRRNVQASDEVLYGPEGTWTWPARRIEVIVDREPGREQPTA
jgi:hypothetical protein